METSNNTNPQGTSNEGKSIMNAGTDNNKYLIILNCCIRRKPGLIALPGQDPAERLYRIGASLDKRTKGGLKGITGDLELKFMPEIVGHSISDPLFRRKVEEYWSSIGKIVPHDEEHLKDHEKGIKLEIRANILGNLRHAKLKEIIGIEEKLNYLNTLLVTNNKDNLPCATLEHESLADYLLLNYALKYPKVANKFEDVDKSNKIEFYIFEKSVAVAEKLSAIELRAKAMKLYETLEDSDEDTRQIDGILLAFEKDLTKFENSIDKLIEIDELYNASTANMSKFIKLVEDSDWEYKYIVNKALSLNNLSTPVNTTAIYYGESMLGVAMKETVHFLKNEEKGQQIFESLKKEIKNK